MLRGLVGRVGLAGEHDLHRPIEVGEDAREPIGVVEDHLRTLVGGEPPRVAEREGFRIEHRARRDNAALADVLLREPRPHPLADEGKQIHPQHLPHLPDLGIGNVVEALPQLGLVDVIEPAGPEVIVQQREDRAGHPGRHVHAVGDAADRQLIGRRLGPHRPPHRPRHLAVQRAHAVDELRRAQRERGHIEQRSAAVVVFAQREEVLAVLADLAPRAGEIFLDEVEGERIVSGRHRRVGRKHRRALHFLERIVERAALLDHLADALQGDEGGVAFVQVPHRGRNAHGPQRAHAADAENDLLLDARFAIAAVEPRRQFTVPRRVFREVGVEQEQPHASEPHAPHRGEHGAIAERYRGDAGTSVRGDRRLDRRVRPADFFVTLFLPAVVGHALAEVALRIHEARRRRTAGRGRRLPYSGRRPARRGRPRRSAATGAAQTPRRNTRWCRRRASTRARATTDAPPSAPGRGRRSPRRRPSEIPDRRRHRPAAQA